MPPSSTTSDDEDLLSTVRQTLGAHRMLDPGDRVLVGVSGGPDSMALLHLLVRLRPAWGIDLGVAHLNHGLREEAAEREAEMVRQAAIALGLPFHVARARVLKVKQHLGLSLEEAARRVRYGFFRRTMTMGGYNKLALGHHLDDNAEQVLLALLRGAGPRGLAGIAPVRQHRIVRPLIDVRRCQIENYILRSGITVARDASNDDPRFLRNRIRQHLLPLLAADYNPRIHTHLHQLAEVMRMEESWGEEAVQTPYAEALVHRDRHNLALSLDRLHRHPPALVRRLLRRALADLAGSLRRIAFVHIHLLLDLATTGKDRQCHLPGGIRGQRTGDRLWLRVNPDDHGRWRRPPAIDPPEPAETVLEAPAATTVKSHAMGVGLRFFTCGPRGLPPWPEVGGHRVFFDVDRLTLPLSLRRPRPGDRFSPLGTAGSQKLKKFFIDHHIPRPSRTTATVLTDRDRIVWVVGHRMDDRVKVTPATTRVLGVEFFLLDNR